MSNTKIIFGIFEKLYEEKCSLKLNGENLALETPVGYSISSDLLKDIRDHKAEIIEILREKEDALTYENILDEHPLVAFDRNEVDRIPLSFTQKRFWLIDQLEGSTHYHIPMMIELKGEFEQEAFDYAWRYIMERYEIFRTVFRKEGGEIYQHIMPADKWEIEYHEAATWSDERLVTWVENEVKKPFDLSEDYLLRINVHKISKDRTGIVIVFHHITLDGWCSPLVRREFMEVYNAFRNNKEPELSPLNLQYADYAYWEQNYLTGDLLKQKLEWWTDYLEGAEPIQLPLDFPRPATQSIRGGKHFFTLDKALSQDLNDLSKKEQATLFMILLAGLKVLLYKYSGQEDICIGTPIANRTRIEVEKMVGCFLNTLVLRSDLSNSPSFSTVLERLRKSALKAYQHQDVPVDLIIEQVVKERDTSHRPLFQTLFLLQNLPPRERAKRSDEPAKVETLSHTIVSGQAKFDLSFLVNESSDGIHFGIDYCADLFKPETIEGMGRHYEQLMRSIIDSPNIPINQLAILNEVEEKQLNANITGEKVPVLPTKTVLDFFEGQVRKTPEASAIIFKEKALTYQEIDKISNQLAHFLQNNGVKEESLVGLSMDNSPELIISLLGILKAGGAYVPISPDFGAHRKDYILKDSQASMMLASRDSLEILASDSELPEDRVFYIEELWEQIEHFSTEKPENNLKPHHLAYVIYTSGSTGKPKGVMINHSSLLDYTLGFAKYFSINEQDKVIQQSAISFDTLVEEIYPALISGASILPIREGGKDILSLKNCIEHGGATLLSTTPMVLEWLGKSLEGLGDLRYVISGGELLLPSQIDAYFGKIPVINSYGPSEATVCATYHEILSQDEASIIGSPIRNREVYILSPNLEIQPIGIKGEIYIGGAGLARGYIGNKELDKERFIDHPFDPGEKLYRTGDLGKCLADGRIEFLGRSDDQVKLRGYRIELGEIEHVIREEPSIKDCAVNLRKGKEGVKMLVAYVVCKDTFDQQLLQNFLHERLPVYMIPATWVVLDQLPLNANGKINRASLPEPDYSGIKDEASLPAETDIEAKLVEIWEELLETSPIGVNQNFFELGFFSLKAMEAVFRIEDEFELKISVRRIFESGNIKELARLIEDAMIIQKNALSV